MTVLMTAAPKRASRPNEPVGTLILDVESTVCGIDGFEWLAARRGELVARRVAELTHRAAQADGSLEQVYGARLAEIRPRRSEVDLLARAYVEALAPDARESVARMRRSGVQVVLVSSGIRHALLRLAFHLGLGPDEVHAVHVGFDAIGAYTGYDAASPLVRADGKGRLVATLALDGPVVAVGGSASDLAMRAVVDRFVAFTGNVCNSTVVASADAAAGSFADIERVVLS